MPESAEPGCMPADQIDRPASSIHPCKAWKCATAAAASMVSHMAAIVRWQRVCRSWAVVSMSDPPSVFCFQLWQMASPSSRIYSTKKQRAGGMLMKTRSTPLLFADRYQQLNKASLYFICRSFFPFPFFPCMAIHMHVPLNSVQS